MLGEVASDDIAGSDPLQQLLRFLQAPPRPDSLGEGVFVLPAHLSWKGNPLNLNYSRLHSFLFFFNNTNMPALYYFLQSAFCVMFLF